jgi:hypothetical protein
MLRYATPFCLTNSASYVQGYNGKTVRNDKSSVIASASEAISPLVCRQIPQGMLRYATPFCLTNSTSYVQDNNGKTVTNHESSGSAFYGSLIGKAPMHPSPRGALIIPKEYWSRYNVIVFSPTVSVYSSTMLSGVSTDRTHS